MTDIPKSIRPYRPEDRAAVRAICCRTAYRNRGSSAAFEDDELFADYWTRYFTDFDSRYCYVVEEDGEIVGYFLGSADQDKFTQSMARKIVPNILFRLLYRLVMFRYREPSTYRFIWWFLIDSWREIPAFPYEKYPAQYHCNLLRKGYRKHYYTTLALIFMDRLEQDGVTHVRGHITEPPDKGIWGRLVVSKGFHFHDDSAETKSSFDEKVLRISDPMINKVWGWSVGNYRQWLNWIGDEFGI